MVYNVDDNNCTSINVRGEDAVKTMNGWVVKKVEFIGVRPVTLLNVMIEKIEQPKEEEE